MDIVSPEQRSKMMARIRGRDTKPEMIVRKLVHAMGYRFRLHRKDLPGSPDLVFSRQKKVIFVHGCFWHRHADCRFAYMPKSNQEFWSRKFYSNLVRDEKACNELRAAGWAVKIVWECETNDLFMLAEQMKNFLDAT